jgi:PhoPQ-activated pathogenicity-related protein
MRAFSIVAAILFGSVCGCGSRANEPAKSASPLADYVAKKDDAYRWVKRREGKLGVTTYAELILTSQKWRDITWKHQLFLIKPSTVDKDSRHALLFITGGGWNDSLEKPAAKDDKLPKEAGIFAGIAEQLRSPVAILLHVPHQPILGGKSEDAAISYTFEQFLRTRDPEWPLLLPMVKSAVRGMDATIEYADKEWSHKIEKFTVTGASKRGWTTWLTGAVDPRAVALAPMVIDMLNTNKQMKHQVATWGTYSEQIRDYTDRGLQRFLDSAPGEALNAIVDPYSYRARLTQPKLILLGTNDRYWPLDALNLYWDGLVGEKYVLYIPNNGHGLKDYLRIAGGLNALHQHANGGRKMPKLSWDLRDADGGLKLTVRSDEKPRQVQAWIATAPTRDFRDAKWASFATTADGDAFTYTLPIPERGFAAMFGEAAYENTPAPLFLSTNVRIVTREPAKTPATGK